MAAKSFQGLLRPAHSSSPTSSDKGALPCGDRRFGLNKTAGRLSPEALDQHSPQNWTLATKGFTSATFDIKETSHGPSQIPPQRS